MYRVADHTGCRAGAPSPAVGTGRWPRARHRISALLFVGLLCLGLTGTASHSHDGAANPTSCAVCHGAVQPAADAPVATPLVAPVPAVELPAAPRPPLVPPSRQPSGTLGPRAPPL